MDRVAVLVDAGYFFAAGSALVGGGEKSKRSLITLDVEATIKALKRLALTTTGRELLRIYWYDGASARTGPSAEHIRIAHCNDVKLRLGFLNGKHPTGYSIDRDVRSRVGRGSEPLQSTPEARLD
jgi:hypothetical protein